MSDALTTLTHFINSPPGQLAAGGVLAGIVWKFFERVEAVLTDQTKLEIAVWLLGVKVGQTVEPWPETFVQVFERVFTGKHWSWACFGRSYLVSMAALIIAISWHLLTHPLSRNALYQLVMQKAAFFVACTMIGSTVLSYGSLWLTRLFIDVLRVHLAVNRLLGTVGSEWLPPVRVICQAVMTLIVPIIGTYVFGLCVLWVEGWIKYPRYHGDLFPLWASLWDRLFVQLWWLWFLPAFFTSIWLWLYAGSGFLLKAARRFDLGFDWFNRRFDIEKKPLQSIGLVAGVLVAVVYWTAVIVSRVIG
jgi:hypothetical protein